MKYYLFAFGLLFTTSYSIAQQSTLSTAEISGKVLEETTGEGLAFANVILKDADQNLIQGVITNEEGTYNLKEIPVGSFIIEASYTGFGTYTQQVEIKVERQKTNLDPIVLKEDPTQLNEVIVTGEVSQVSLRLDKKIFRVGKDVLSQSTSVSEVLENVPSVSVDPSGTVMLRGNANVTILINGRRSGLTSAQALEQISSDNVDRVEVITTPSARYEASGSAGIINIILKKNTKGGLTGRLSAGLGNPTDSRGSGSLSYKTDKLNLFTTLGIRYTNYEGDYTRQQRSIRNNETVFLDQVQDQHRHDDGQWIYIGADYYINDKNTFTTAFYRNETKDTDVTDFIYDYSSNSSVLDSTLITDGNSKERRSYNQLEMNYTKTFAKKGRKLTFDLQYDFYDSTMKWNVINHKVNPIIEPNFNLRTVSTDKNNDIALQTDYITPIGEQAKLEFGAKLENRSVKDSFTAEELINDSYELIDDLDNKIAYDERIIGAYIQYGNEKGKFSYLLGLRIEDTDINIKDEVGEFDSANHYTNLFPTLNLGYAFNDNMNMGVSYSKRINRPSLRLLNPFSELEDFNSRFFGNLDLKPAYTDAVEASALVRGSNFTLNPSIYYSYTTNSTRFFTTQNEAGIFETGAYNLDEEERIGVEISASYNPLKWLSFNGSLNAYKFNQEGAFGTQNLKYSDDTWFTTLSSSIKFNHGITFQGRYNYQGKRGDAQSLRKPVSYLNMGLSKKLFDNQGNLTFNVSNVFNSRKYSTETTGTNFFLSDIRSRNAARWSLSFSYRFDGKTGFKNRNAQRSNRN